MKNLAIIPARGGSKRIPRKNIKDFLGKPIISYSIETAIGTNLFDEIMVSTDDDEIAEIAKKYGAQIPFLRSIQTANDHATLAEVLIETVGKYKEMGKEPENICCILSTAPLITGDDIFKAYSMLTDFQKYDSICPIVQFSFPILRSLVMNTNGYINMKWPEYMNCRSQDLEAAYHDAGLFYWVKTEALIKYNTMLTSQTGGMVIDEAVAQDIDTESDWKLAELKYRLLKKNPDHER